ncbi:MAG TPA: hypothetical protein VFO82_17055, partial [Steroidobacteraceae bacterium]|nr:hypothetical protein [Steroidobacteraceae bacterium]
MLAGPGAAQLVVTPPALRPDAPTQLLPNGAANAAIPTLRWQQGAVYALQPQPPAAQFFRICIYDPAAAQTCGTPAAQWFYGASDPLLHRIAVTRPFNPSPIVSTFAYSLRMPPNAVPLDRRLTWNVGACSSQALTSCSYSRSTALYLSTRNVVAVNINEIPGNARISVTPIVRNAGTTATGVFSVHLRIARALYDASGTCATSIDSEGVESGDVAVTADGEEIVLQSSEVPGTVGIYRRTQALEYDGTASMSLSAGATGAGSSVDHAAIGADLPAAYLIM